MTTEEKIELGLDFLNARNFRCTYAAFGGYIGVTPRRVGKLLGEPSQRTSWVVDQETQLPSSEAGYTEEHYHPKLQERSEGLSIRTAEKMEILVNHWVDSGRA